MRRRFVKTLLPCGVLFCAAWLSATVAWAQDIPKQLVVEYEVTRKGQPFAKVSETFRQEQGHYTIESVTKGLGVYAILGNRTLKSEGEITEQGLQPLHFVLQQEPNKRTVRVDFDWATHQITVNNKGKVSTKPLPPNTLDLASMLYQSMFVPPKPGETTLSVVTGKKVRQYRYAVEANTQTLATALGSLNVVHLSPVNAAAADADKDENANDEGKHFWLSPDKWYLLVKMTMSYDADDGLEQRITKLHVE